MPNSNGAIQVACWTSVSKWEPFIIDIRSDWAPLGAKRFLELVADDFFNNATFFRVMPKFLVQFGIGSEPEKNRRWARKGEIKDDPKRREKYFERGYVSFAGSRRDSRLSEVFIATVDGENLGTEPWEVPFGFVSSGMNIIDSLYSGYGDVQPYGKGPNQNEIYRRGNAYLNHYFSKLSYIRHCEILNNPNSPSGIFIKWIYLIPGLLVLCILVAAITYTVFKYRGSSNDLHIRRN